MKLQIFAVHDKQIGAYLPPFYVRTVGEAVRSFTEAVNDPAKPFGKYALDYSLCNFGEWDDAAGSFLVHDPVRVIGANEVIELDIQRAPDVKSMVMGR